jgi:type I restriction enzyme, S subunit
MKFKLQEIVDVTMGQSPKSEFYNTERKGYPFLQGNRTFGFKYPTFDTYTTVMTKPAKAGDVIMSVRAPVGDLNITPVDMCLGRGVCSLRMKNGNQSFLYYMMKYYVPHLLKKESGTVFGSVNRNDINGLEVDIPEDEQNQRRIARYLEMIDEKIELNTAINNNLEEQASAIYQAWFEDFTPFDGNCPAEWKQGVLSDIANVTSGKRPPMKSAEKTDIAPIPLVGAASVMGFTSESNHVDKILVTGRVGTHGVVQRFSTPCWTSDNTLVITSDLYEYTYQILQRIDYHAMNRGSTQPLITQGDMNKVAILIPDRQTLDDFEALVGQLMLQCEANLLENAKLTELRDSLLPRLMSGELDVSDIDF